MEFQAKLLHTLCATSFPLTLSLSLSTSLPLLFSFFFHLHLAAASVEGGNDVIRLGVAVLANAMENKLVIKCEK